MSDEESSSEEEFNDFEDEEESEEEKKPAAKRKKNTSRNNDDDDDDDNYDDDDDEPVAKRKKKVESDDDDDDYNEEPKKKSPKISIRIKSSSPAAGSAGVASMPKKDKKKKAAAADSNDDDDDDNDDEKVKRKKKATSAAVAKKKKPDEKKRKAAPPASSPAAVASSASATKKKKASAAASAAGAAAGNNKELKKLDKTERLQYAMQAFLWWEAPVLEEGINWSTMEHAGVSFPEDYVPHGIKMLYDGKPIDLTPLQEEAATFFAGMDPDGMHLGNANTAPIFIKNFFEDFKEILGKKHVVKEFKKCNFEPIRRHLNEQKIIKKAITDEQRKSNKDDRNQALYKYGYSIVDGHIEKVGNYNMEPPGAFRGRGAHPKMGKLKSRVLPEQVSVNLSECAPVPKCPVAGHGWSDIKHDPRGQWLATWKENINGQSKYMQLAAQSSFKGKSDRSKYSKAALLCKNIEKIRKSYKKDLKSRDAETKQLATATWVIDRLALRVGGEKDTEEEADTVGCCSLRVEHLHFDPNEEGGDNKEIELEFLGKDSMLFKQTIDFGNALYNENSGMGTQIYENLKAFCKNKKKSDEVFNAINPTTLNAHLKKFMDGLSAKVFRTYNASKTLQDELRKHESAAGWSRLTAAEKVVEYNSANREVAILCNHQRSVSKAQETQLENISGKVKTLKKQKKELKQIYKKLLNDKTDGIPTRKSFQTMDENVKKALAKAKSMKEAAKTNDQKIKATEADEAAKQKKRDLATAKFEKQHLWEKVPTADQVKKRIENWSVKISKMEMDLKHKDDNKEVSLGTSKINYMDPRISVAWCKRNEVPIEKIFSKTLRDKFNWAMAVPPSWEFNETIGKEA